MTLTVLTSCKTREARAMDRLNSLSEKIEKYGANWDADQWADALEEIQDIHYDLEDCEWTEEQAEAMGRVEGRLMAVIINEGAKAAKKSVKDYVSTAAAFMRGFEDGANEYKEENIKELVEEINELQDSFN